MIEVDLEFDDGIEISLMDGKCLENGINEEENKF